MDHQFSERVNLIGLIDHSSRAGNVFFLTLFDQHPEVLTCPLVQYIYSYVIAEFGEEQNIEADRARDFILNRSYFRYVFQEPDQKLSAELTRFGADSSMKIDRGIAIKTFTDAVAGRPTVTRRQLILAAYYAYAVAVGRDISRIRYVLVSDVVSLREENVLQGFSGKVVRAMIADFPDARCVSLVRDLHAAFASCRQQYVNQNGNMYGFAFGSYWRRLKDLVAMRLSTDGCVYLFWLAYFASASVTVARLKAQYSAHFSVVRNEDLNTRFIPSIQSVCDWLGVSFVEDWLKPDYVPTTSGRPWRGIGAYNSRYQTHVHGLLENDPPAIAETVTGPNVYVTQRWKTRLSAGEIALVNMLYEKELRALGYLSGVENDVRTAAAPVIMSLLPPLRGEFPSLRWIAKGRSISAAELFQRVFYALTFLPFYIASRISLLRMYRRGHFNTTAGPG